MESQKAKQIKITFPNLIHGYWDGGAKQEGLFKVGDYLVHPGQGHWLKWGCWELNAWFTAASGRTWNEAIRNAVFRLRHLIKDKATKIEIVEEGK